MKKRYYDAERVDTFLHTFRVRAQDSINVAMAETQSSSSDVVSRLQQLDRTYASIERGLAALGSVVIVDPTPEQDSEEES